MQFRWVPGGSGLVTALWPADCGRLCGGRRRAPRGCRVAVDRRRHRLLSPSRARGDGGGAVRLARRPEVISASAAVGWVAQKPLCDRRLRPWPFGLVRPVRAWQAPRRPGASLFGRRRVAVLGAGDVARGGARVARVTAEPDTGRARRWRVRLQIRAGVG